MTYPASRPMGTRAVSAGLNWSWSEADHSVPHGAEIKINGAVTPPSYMSSKYDAYFGQGWLKISLLLYIYIYIYIYI